MKDFLERTKDGEPRWWRSGAGGLTRWKKEVKIGDLVCYFKDKQPIKTIGVITGFQINDQDPSSDRAIIHWLPNEYSSRYILNSEQYMYSIYPMEMGEVCK